METVIIVFLFLLITVSLAVLIISLIVAASKKVSHFENDNSQGNLKGYNLKRYKFPKIIWTFWHDENVPRTVKMCMDSWKKHNPNYEIRLITLKNLDKYTKGIKDTNTGKQIDIPNLYSLKTSGSKYQYMSDFIRLNIMAEYGGIWCDSTCICTQSFDEWIEENSFDEYPFIGYNIENFQTTTTPVLESWFFVCIKGSYFVNEWKKEFMKINNFKDKKEYNEHLKKMGVDFQNIPQQLLYYLTVHLAAQYILQKNSNIKIDIPGYEGSIRLIVAADKDVGPLHYLNESGWKSDVAVNKVCKDHLLISKPIIKFRQMERAYIENNNINCEL